MILAHDTVGSGVPVAFVHGFTQTRSSWMPLVSQLGGVECTLIDAPGHGESAGETLDLHGCGDGIAATMTRGALVGYSMGARMALHAALDHPENVTSLVLMSGTAGIEDTAERADRRRADDALADRIEQIGVDDFIDEWLGSPMFAGLPAAASMRDERRRNTAHGLAGSLRNAGTGTQENLWPRLVELTVPVLIVTGDLDEKFTSIGGRLHSAIPGSRWERVAGSGHTVHLEATSAVAAILNDWLVRN
jgi:2-succinyl-6-hydroxy-2,4-cyclohexadiene-1-carboxylate synthase